MKGTAKGIRSFMIGSCLLVVVGAMSSCSFFEGKPPPKMLVEPTRPRECELLFCDVDLTYPLIALTSPTLYVYKSDRRLLVVENKVLVRDYRIGLGPQPRGDKYLRGDGRTPEGDFFVCVKNPASKYYKSLGLNYPAPRHAEEAFRLGAIRAEDYLKIKQANECKTLPPAGTPLGGDIFIHGGGGDRDWTLGCIALRNTDMDELFETIPVGTPVTIFP